MLLMSQPGVGQAATMGISSPRGDLGTQGFSSLWLGQKASEASLSGSEHRRPASQPEDSTGGLRAGSGHDTAPSCTHSGPHLSATATADCRGGASVQITLECGRVSAPPQHSPAFSPSRAPAVSTPSEERGRIKQTSCQPTRRFRGLGEITLCTDFQRKPTYHPNSPFPFPLSFLAKETNHVWCQPSLGGLTTSLPALVTVGARHGMQTPAAEDSDSAQHGETGKGGRTARRTGVVLG